MTKEVIYYISDALSSYVSVFLSFEVYYKIFYIEKERKEEGFI